MALRFFQGDRHLQAGIGQTRQQVLLLLIVSQLLDQTASEHHRMQVRLQAQAAAQLGHDQLGFHPAAAKAAEFLGERYGGQAEGADLLPQLAGIAQPGLAELLALLEAIGVAHQTGSGVLQHLLLFAQFEVHALPLTARESSWR
ncbi:hypothetical protein D3C81_1469590 [compost metagenome]